MTAEVTIVPQMHPVLIRFPEQSDYENNKTRIKRIIKTKYKLNKFVFTTGEWLNENDTEKSVVVKRFTDENGYTNALLFKGSQQLLEDVKTLLDSLKINYEEKEISDQEIQKQETKQELPKPEPPPPSIASKAPATELTPEEILKMLKETENCSYKNYAAGRIRDYNAEIDRKVRLGLLDEEQANKIKEKFSGKMDSFIHKWSEAGDKWLKERLAELKAEPEEDFEDLRPEVKSIKKKKGTPKPLERQTKEITDLPEEFAIADIGDLFGKEGYDKKKIIENAYHDIYNLIEKNKIIFLEGTKPKKYRIVSRDTSDLG